MQQDPEILALQRRVESLERILRSGVAVNQAAPGGLPDASDGTVFGQIPKTGTPPNEEHGTPEALSTPELGTSDNGGGSLKVFTDPKSFDVQDGKHIKTIAGANLQAVINGTAYDFVQVSTITTESSAPTYGGIKGQLHCIYTGA